MFPTSPRPPPSCSPPAALLLGVSVLFSRASQRTGVPIALLFLLVGMLAGSEGIGGHRLRRLPLRLPARHARAGADPVRRRAQHPAQRGAEGGRARPACSPRWACRHRGAGGGGGPLRSGSAGPRRCCSAPWSRPPMRRRCSRCSAAAASSSSGGWASPWRWSRASTTRWRSSSPPCSPRTCFTPGSAAGLRIPLEIAAPARGGRRGGRRRRDTVDGICCRGSASRAAASIR